MAALASCSCCAFVGATTGEPVPGAAVPVCSRVDHDVCIVSREQTISRLLLLGPFSRSSGKMWRKRGTGTL